MQLGYWIDQIEMMVLLLLISMKCSNNLREFEMFYIMLILHNASKGRCPTTSPYIW
jgi:hypothetical protein